jgi:hypothetical protein
MAETMLERMARAAYEKHPLRNVAFKDNVIEAPPVDWNDLDDFEKGMMLDAQRAALKAMIDAVQSEL